MEFNPKDWYEKYETPATTTGGYPTYRSRNSRKKSAGVKPSTLIGCMLLTLLLGGVFGALFTRSYVDRRISALESTVAASAAQPVQTAAAPVLTEQTAGIPVMEAAAATGSFSKAQIIELCAPAVVGIDVSATYSGYGFGSGPQEVTTGSGSGIILTSDGYLVTCNHVVEGAQKITVILNDDTAYEAKIIGTDTRNDLAVIKIEATGLTPATLGDSDMLTVGEDVIAIGNPLGELRGTATGGMVSALNRDVDFENMTMSLIQTDAAISPGNSGGGLFNGSGSLIGIVNAKASSTNSEGLGFAIPVNSVKQIISDLMVHGYVRGRAYLGVYTQNVTLSSGQNGWGSGSFFGSYFGGGGTACVQVAQLVSGSAAEASGIQVGDLILSIGDKTVSSNEDLSAAISGYNAGETATLSIQRNGQQMTVNVTFGEYSPNN